MHTNSLRKRLIRLWGDSIFSTCVDLGFPCSTKEAYNAASVILDQGRCGFRLTPLPDSQWVHLGQHTFILTVRDKRNCAFCGAELLGATTCPVCGISV